ncbi:MAG: hypothetical protein JWN04_3232 [Myxococcaceae bacterium]|nr:hypothetical protein [Myxococcaceae bacterium]
MGADINVVARAGCDQGLRRGGVRIDLGAMRYQEDVRTLPELFTTEVGGLAAGGSYPWTNAEDYVEFLELAAQGHPHAKKFVIDMLGETKTPAEIAHEARNYLRAVTHVFVENANIEMERWSPYRPMG